MQPDLSFLAFEASFSDPSVVTAYDEVALWSAMFGALLLEEVPLSDVRVALDVGCGTGFPLLELAERLGAGAHVHGIDPWKEGLTRAAEKQRLRGIRNVTIHEGSANALPFEDGTFDLIVSNLGLNNFEDAPGAIRECRRVSRPGSAIALTTNLQGHMRELYEVFDHVLSQQGDDAGLERLRAHISHRATVAAVRDLLTEGGFEVSKVVERESVMRFANGRALFNHYFIKLGFLEAWKEVVPGREPAVFSQLQESLDVLAAREGELRLTIPMAYVEGIAR